MKKIYLSFSLCLFAFIGLLYSQNPYASLGEETTVLTLSEGKYQEHFPNESVVIIGGVKLNTETGKIVEFIDEEAKDASFESTVSTRFLSVDPIGRQYPELTPYQFASNRPIDGIDLDGLEWRQSTQEEITSFNGSGQTSVVKEGEVGYIYQTSGGTHFTYVGEHLYKSGNNLSSNPGRLGGQERITFDSKTFPRAEGSIPYERLRPNGTVGHIYHNEYGDDALSPWMYDAWFYFDQQLTEIPGEEHHPWIIKMHQNATKGWIPTTDDNAGPWCSSFACYVMDNSQYNGENLESPKNAYSLTWRDWGTEIDEPVYGAIAVKTRSGGGHVGFVVGQNDSGTQLAILGGNQNNEVNVSLYNKSIFRFFVPNNYKAPDFSKELPVYNNRVTNPSEQ